jgi:glyoxylase-like metal-dependent hydrolase (beta-lactamase superfamily II)
VAVHPTEHHVVAEGKPLRREFGPIATQVDNVVELTDGEPYRAGSLEFEVLHTPGHSPGGISLRIDGYVFTGDALFAGSIGRSDFANSDGRKLIAGIRAKLLSLPDETIVYSGHGPATTIGRERKTNPFLL